MEIKFFNINDIPAALWGGKSEKLIIAVHGNMSDKMDAPVKIMAENAVAKGYQVLSFDLADHGERKGKGELFKVQNCVEDLKAVYGYAEKNYKSISIFAVSIGAYFSLLAYREVPICRAWFLSPVTNMRRIIENMMKWFNVTSGRLEKEGEIQTPIGQTLYWDYYCYVLENPIKKWDTKTNILYGGLDDMCERELVVGFAEEFHCFLDIIEGAGHYFHTEMELEELNRWFKRTM